LITGRFITVPCIPLPSAKPLNHRHLDKLQKSAIHFAKDDNNDTSSNCVTFILFIPENQIKKKKLVGQLNSSDRGREKESSARFSYNTTQAIVVNTQKAPR